MSVVENGSPSRWEGIGAAAVFTAMSLWGSAHIVNTVMRALRPLI